MNGNKRADALNIVRASSVFNPSCIKTLNVKKQFSLENLAEGTSIKPIPPYLEEVGPTSWGFSKNLPCFGRPSND